MVAGLAFNRLGMFVSACSATILTVRGAGRRIGGGGGNSEEYTGHGVSSDHDDGNNSTFSPKKKLLLLPLALLSLSLSLLHQALSSNDVCHLLKAVTAVIFLGAFRGACLYPDMPHGSELGLHKTRRQRRHGRASTQRFVDILDRLCAVQASLRAAPNPSLLQRTVMSGPKIGTSMYPRSIRFYQTCGFESLPT